jgi:hypothetical protein
MLAPDDLMRRVGAYVERYGAQASVIISVERYKQEYSEPRQVMVGGSDISGFASPSQRGGSRPSRAAATVVRTQARTLVSELALVRNDAAIGGWLAYRDVVEVDKKPVGDRRDRLQTLLQHESPDTDEAKRMTIESARFNMGPVMRTFNVPTATLFFFHPGNLARFTFRRKGSERVDGVDAWKIDFEEIARPSLIMTTDGTDVMASGTLWINPADGTILRTHMAVSGYRTGNSRAEIDVTYRRDAALGMLMPAKMTERYDTPVGRISGEATYSDFKRFQTAVKVK